MKKILIITLLLIASISFAQNSLLEADFWKSNPSLKMVETQIKKGNSPSEANKNNFDATTLAINNDADFKVIEFLINQKGNSIKKLTHDGRIYLHWAAYRGNIEVVKYLLDKGSNINQTDDKGATPLEFAASAGQANPALYELLFKAGVDPNQKYKNGANVLLLAIGSDNDLQLATYLDTKGLTLSSTDNLGNTAFNYAAKNGNMQLLKKLHDKGIKYDGRALVMASQGTRSSTTPMATYRYLVEKLNINPNSVGDDRENVLHNLVKKSNQNESIAYFLAKGVDVNHQDRNGNTVLMNAMRGPVEVVEMFIPNVKDLNITNNKGLSALSYAVENGSADMVDYLLSKGEAKATVIDKNGNNLVYYWMQYYKPSAKNDDFEKKAALLQKAGLNFNTPQKDGSTLYHLAIAKNNLDLLMKIEKVGADINAQNLEGMTVLHKAALTSNDDAILKYLVSKGARKDLKTEFDETAYDLASENELLIKNKVSLKFLK